MSLTYFDSMSRYGATDKADANGFLDRYGWTRASSLFRHRTQASMFGQPYLSMHPTWYDDGEGTQFPVQCNLTRAASGLVGMSFKYAHFWSSSATHGEWIKVASIQRTGGNNIAIGFLFNSTSLSAVLPAVCVWPNAAQSGEGVQITYFPSNAASTVATTVSAVSANITALSWHAVDMFLSGSGASTTLNWRVVNHAGHVIQNAVTVGVGTVTSVTIGRAYNGDGNSTLHGYCYSDVVTYVNDSVGLTGFPDNPRNFRVQRLVPDANGSQNNWTPASGTNFGAVSETPYADANFSSGSGIGTKQTFHFGALGSANESVKAVSAIQLNPNILDAGTLVTAAAPIQIIGGTETSMGANLVPSRVAFANSPRIITTNPATSQPYTAAQVSDMEVGFNLA